jgi:uncharacterized sporulation protein YeaH/YhbH (DUF444 family)
LHEVALRVQVRMHVLDGSTGHYLRVGGSDGNRSGNKSNKRNGRRGSVDDSEEEQEEEGGRKGAKGDKGQQQFQNAVTLTPVVTRTFPLRGSSLCAQWQQTLSVDIPYRALLRPEV